MGARGKKRQRADGSTASGKSSSAISASRPAYEDQDAVPADALLQATEIFRAADPGAARTIELAFDTLDKIDALAVQHGVDKIALGIRAEKLANLLERLGESVLWSAGDSESLQIDKNLLEYAAATHIDDSNKPLRWPPEQ